MVIFHIVMLVYQRVILEEFHGTDACLFSFQHGKTDFADASFHFGSGRGK